METKLTVRQINFLFLFLSITTIFNHIPNIAAYNAGGTGYLGILFSMVILFIFAVLLLQVIKAYPDMNFYEILNDIFGTVIAKILIFLYAIWAYYCVTMRLLSYSITMQATLMPSIHPGILITVLFLLIVYTISKRFSTIFRFAEFSYQAILLFMMLVFVFALPNIDYTELVPVSLIDMENNLYLIPDVCAIGGNLMILLLFGGKFMHSGGYGNIKRRTYHTVWMFTLIAVLSTILAIGLNGSKTTMHLAYPIFQAIKSVSILNTFERFDSFVTLIIVFSDFAAITLFLVIAMKCLSWAFGGKESRVCTGVLLFVACAYVLIKNYTQYEFYHMYANYQIYINLAFQYIVPTILGIICSFKSEVKAEAKENQD